MEDNKNNQPEQGNKPYSTILRIEKGKDLSHEKLGASK